MKKAPTGFTERVVLGFEEGEEMNCSKDLGLKNGWVVMHNI